MVLLAEPSATFALIQMSKAVPIFFGLALHRWRIRIFNFDPMQRTPGAIGRTNPLANDALATKSTGFAVDNHAVLVKTLVENETELRAA